MFQMSVDFHFTTWKLGFLNISEYLARYGIQMDPSFNERRWQSGKKPVFCMLGLLSTIIREGVIWSRKCYSWKDCPGAWAQLSTDNVNFCTRSCPYQREASRPSGPGRFFFEFFSLPPTPRSVFNLLSKMIIELTFENLLRWWSALQVEGRKILQKSDVYSID